MTSAIQTPRGYPAFLRDIKDRVRTAQVRASLAVNRELILLYWSIGRDILARQKVAGWGAKIIDRLASDLAAEFPGVEGFSSRSLKYMRAFADAWPEEPIVQQLVAQLPWGHHTRLLDRIKDRTTREWYLHAAIENGWSQNILVHQITTQLHPCTAAGRLRPCRANPERSLPLRLLDPGRKCSGARPGARPAHSSS
jgi:predicted nuclease of restriction endonuclease-like (RecB) superfamily